MVEFIRRAAQFMNNRVEVLPKVAHQRIAMKDAFVQMAPFNMMANAFESMNVHAHCVANNLKPVKKSKRIVIRANVNVACGNVRMKHAVHGAEPSVTHIIKRLMESISISWENARTIY